MVSKQLDLNTKFWMFWGLIRGLWLDVLGQISPNLSLESLFLMLHHIALLLFVNTSHLESAGSEPSMPLLLVLV